MASPRRHLLDALQADLVGPYDPATGAEVLRRPPLRWYLTGFLVPEAGAVAQTGAAGGDEDEELDAGTEHESDAAPAAKPEAKQRPLLHRVPVSDAPGVHVEYRVELIAPADAEALRIGAPGQGARAVSVDREKALVGSANFSNRGRDKNLEVGALVRDHHFVQSLAAAWEDVRSELGEVEPGASPART